MKATREFYIPAGGVPEHFPAVNAVVYRYAAGDKLYAAAFSGKRSKPDFHYRFKDAEARELHIKGWLKGLEAGAASKAERAAKRKAFQHTLQVGDILGTCWGYDQTNREFFEVVEVCGKHVVVREVAGDYKENGFMAGETRARRGAYIGEPIRKLVSPYNQIKMASWGRYASLYAKAGTPNEAMPKVYESHYA